MENHNRNKIRKALGDTPVVTPGIPDKYEFMQPQLVALLKERLPRYADWLRMIMMIAMVVIIIVIFVIIFVIIVGADVGVMGAMAAMMVPMV
ncbi:hypothetical protein [Breoghania sp. L-A4]|uniref:hypothetical protein n=1 Tax=Breoghania sp. L-A4 TaxID=2304600 RepID=UPI000E358078|nr:hypothetical protein [Breoghania sp. L-A4]AXS39795.1 hypothetical protein D1F64_06670 [Breoghania sp. L-A4]